MIKRSDFQIHIVTDLDGPRVEVLHVPTGSRRSCSPLKDEPVGHVRDRLVRELTHLVFRENEFEVSVGRSTSGTFLLVIHKPSGKTRVADPVGQRPQGALREEMIDDILEEIFREQPREG